MRSKTPEQKKAHKERLLLVKGYVKEDKKPKPLKHVGARAKRLKPGDDAMAKACKDRDDWTCQKCMNPNEALHAHHIHTKGGNADMRHDLDNLITLCWRCHGWAHDRPAEFATWLESYRMERA